MIDIKTIGRLVNLEALQNLGYFEYPASINYHGNKSGGLYEHSYNVADFLMWMTERNNLIWERKESPLIVGFLHDLCKLDDYDMTAEGWKYNPNPRFKGHGDKSVLIASTLTKLTDEEMKCIRYHMGAFTDKEEWKFYTGAVHCYPNVLWTHQADMMAAHIKERSEDNEK